MVGIRSPINIRRLFFVIKTKRKKTCAICYNIWIKRVNKNKLSEKLRIYVYKQNYNSKKKYSNETLDLVSKLDFWIPQTVGGSTTISIILNLGTEI